MTYRIKSEIRSSKSETNETLKFEIQKSKSEMTVFGIFYHLDLFRVSDFDIRVFSGLSLPLRLCASEF